MFSGGGRVRSRLVRDPRRPLVDVENGLLGVSIVFFDVTATRALVDQVVETNRQVEAAYEELQSTNDELHTINEALRERGLQLDEATAFTESLTGSIQLGLTVVDRQMRVLLWNRACEDPWGLRRDEALGVPLPHLDIGLPADAVKPLIGRVFADADSIEEANVDAVDRRGRFARIRLLCSAFRAADDPVNGAVLLMEVLGDTDQAEVRGA